MAFYEQNISGYGGYEQNVKIDPELVEQYAPLVKYIAGRIALGMPKHVEFDDLVSYGILGLVDALIRFEANRGAKFETYANVRIRGAIYDGLRQMDWIPSSVRAKAKKLEGVITALEHKLGRPAESEEIASELGISLEDYLKRLDDIRLINLISINENLGSDIENDLALVDMIDDPQAALDFLQVEQQDAYSILAGAIDRLQEKEKMVISLYYYDELTLKEIGVVLGLSESRVSQLHTQAILRLRGRLGRVKKKLF